MAIYKGDTKVAGGNIKLDGFLSATSNNPVPNSVITSALENVGYSTWQKPVDWIDIRSGALDNSIYYLVAHSIPIENSGTYTVSDYPKFIVKSYVSNSGTYDVFVDGQKVATTANETTTTLDWGTLYTNGTLIGGHEVTYPSELVTHVIRVTPSVSTNNFSNVRLVPSENNQIGVLWVHLTIGNAISLNTLLGNYITPCEAVTCKGGTLNVTNLYFACRNATSLQELPVFDLNGETISARNAFDNCRKLTKIYLKNGVISDPRYMFYSCYDLEKIETDNAALYIGPSTFGNALRKVKKLPTLFPSTADNLGAFLVADVALEPTSLDFSTMKNVTRLEVRGDESYQMYGLKSVTVSNEAPFNNATSPQINVSYTGLSRAALINLFNSMPYNNGYITHGEVVITDGVASNFTRTLNFVNTNLAFADNTVTSFEAVIKAKMSTSGGPIFSKGQGTGANGFKAWLRTSKITFSETGSSGNLDINGTFSVGQYYYVRIRINNGTVVLDYSTDGTNYTGEVSKTLGTLSSDKLAPRFGQNYNSGVAFDGEIDLNETYIILNGVPWFRGTAAMTKTCSVVGCTGTADLTAADKAIATGKGWELTVA